MFSPDGFSVHSDLKLPFYTPSSPFWMRMYRLSHCLSEDYKLLLVLLRLIVEEFALTLTRDFGLWNSVRTSEVELNAFCFMTRP